MLTLIFALIGWVVGGLINVLADDLPQRRAPRLPHCPRCDHRYRPALWPAVGRRLWGGGQCPNCNLPTRWRALAVEGGTAVIFALLPSFIPPGPALILNTIYVAVFILVIVIDVEHRLILHIVTLPVTVLALLGSFFVDDNSFLAALIGMVVGFLLFFGAYWLGQRLFGPGALGFGDVMLAMAMGAMLGLHRVIFALTLAILLGGVGSALLILTRRFHRRSYVPYGPYLAVAGVILLLWGEQIVAWYAGTGGN
jgi:prepilin signal peptidase PulO-like enzyme (type II secretory pathway)